MDTNNTEAAGANDKQSLYSFQSKKALQSFVRQVRTDLDLSIKSDRTNTGEPKKIKKKHKPRTVGDTNTTVDDHSALPPTPAPAGHAVTDAPSTVAPVRKRKRKTEEHTKRSVVKTHESSGISFVDDAALIGSSAAPVVVEERAEKEHKHKKQHKKHRHRTEETSDQSSAIQPPDAVVHTVHSTTEKQRKKKRKSKSGERVNESPAAPLREAPHESVMQDDVHQNDTTVRSSSSSDVKKRKKKLQESFDKLQDAMRDAEEDKVAADSQMLAPEMVHQDGPGPYFNRNRFFSNFEERLKCCFLYALYAIKSSHPGWNENNRAIYERYLQGRLSGDANTRMAKQLKELVLVERMERYRVLLIMNILASMTKLQQESEEFARTRQAGRDHHQKFTLKHSKFLELFAMIRTEGRMEARTVVIQKNSMESAGQNTKECDCCYGVIRKGNLESLDVGDRKCVAHVCSTCREHVFLFSELVHLKSTIFRTYEREIWPNIKQSHADTTGQKTIVSMSDITKQLKTTYKKALANLMSTSVLRSVLTKSPDSFFRMEITMEEDTIRQGADHLNPIFHSSDPRSNPSAVQYPAWAAAMDVGMDD